MTREEYKQILELFLYGEKVYKIVYTGLMSIDGTPPALGYNDGLFGKITALEKMLKKYSKTNNTDVTLNIIVSDKLSIDEKVNILFGEEEETG